MFGFARRLRPPPEPVPERVTVMVGDREVAVRIRVSQRAVRFTLRIAHGPDEPVLTLPARAGFDEALAFLDRHQGWLAERLARRPAAAPFRDGAVVPIRGIGHRIVHRPERRGSAHVDFDADGEPVLIVAGGIEHLPRRVRDHLIRAARADLAAAVGRHAATLGLRATKIRIKDTKSRWGSCTADGELSFSWRVVMAPPAILDYLAAHEVAHLKEMNHSHRFWRLVRETGVEVEASRRWLRRHGAELHAHGVDDALP